MVPKLLAPLFFTMKSKLHLSLVIIAVLANASCSTNSPSKNKSSKSNSKSKIPKVPARSMPGGNEDNWRYLGLSNDGTFGTEINDASIKQIDDNQYSYQERKTIIDTIQYSYQMNTPKYVYSLSAWQMNCKNQSYKISSTTLYDQLGKQIKEITLYSDKELSIRKNSISWQEYNYICNGVGRNIGY